MQLISESNLLKRLALYHAWMITEHFRVRFGDIFLQPLKAAYVKNILSPRNTGKDHLHNISCRVSWT